MECLRSVTLSLILTLPLSPNSPCSGQIGSAHSELSFWTVGGSEGVTARFGNGLVEVYYSKQYEANRVLLALAEAPLTEAEIQVRTALPEPELHALLISLSSVRLLQRDDDGRWTTSVPVIMDQRIKLIKEDLHPIASGVSSFIEGFFSQMTALYDAVKSESDPPWEDVAHLIIDKFIVDGSFHRAVGALERERGIRVHYDQTQKHITAFFLERGENFSTFGTNWYAFNEGDAQREVYVLHGALFRRYDIQMNRYRGDRGFSSALFKVSPEGGLGSLTSREMEMLEELGWVSGTRLAVPLVQAKTLKALLPLADTVGAGAAEVLFENHSIITDSFDKSPHSRFLDAGGDYLQVCYHTLFSSILEELVNSGVLPPLPESIPEHLGVYVVLGKMY